MGEEMGNGGRQNERGDGIVDFDEGRVYSLLIEKGEMKGSRL